MLAAALASWFGIAPASEGAASAACCATFVEPGMIDLLALSPAPILGAIYW